MGSVTIRNINDAVKESARLSAAKNGRSLEAELRTLLEQTYAPTTADPAQIRDLTGDDWVHKLIAIAGGVGLELPPRKDLLSDREIFGAD